MKFKVKGFNKKSNIQLFRTKWFKKGYELINLTTLCDVKLGTSGTCNGFREPDDSIHHIQLWYRDEIVANINNEGSYVIDDDKYLLWFTSVDDFTGSNFILFRKVKVNNNGLD